MTSRTVKLQLQWVTQAQFAGYFAALDQGFYEDQGLDVEILEGGVDIVPQTQLASGDVDFAIAWVPKALASREQGAAITDIAQVFQRSGTLQVSLAGHRHHRSGRPQGQEGRQLGLRQRVRALRGHDRRGIDPSKDVTLVQQQFDMQALLSGEIDAAQAMTYNEYAQVLEAENPDTGELYQPDDFNVINWNDEGTAMLQDAIWADTEKLPTTRSTSDTAIEVHQGLPQGLGLLPGQRGGVRGHRRRRRVRQLGTSHQLWQMNEINKLIWPSPDGVGVIDQAAVGPDGGGRARAPRTPRAPRSSPKEPDATMHGRPTALKDRASIALLRSRTDRRRRSGGFKPTSPCEELAGN